MHPSEIVVSKRPMLLAALFGGGSELGQDVVVLFPGLPGTVFAFRARMFVYI